MNSQLIDDKGKLLRRDKELLEPLKNMEILRLIRDVTDEEDKLFLQSYLRERIEEKKVRVEFSKNISVYLSKFIGIKPWIPGFIASYIVVHNKEDITLFDRYRDVKQALIKKHGEQTPFVKVSQDYKEEGEIVYHLGETGSLVLGPKEGRIHFILSSIKPNEEREEIPDDIRRGVTDAVEEGYIIPTNHRIERLMYHPRARQEEKQFVFYIEGREIPAKIVHHTQTSFVVQDISLFERERAWISKLTEGRRYYSTSLETPSWVINMDKFKPWIPLFKDTYIKIEDTKLEEGYIVRELAHPTKIGYYKPSRKFILEYYGFWKMYHTQTGEIFSLYIGRDHRVPVSIIHSTESGDIIQNESIFRVGIEWINRSMPVEKILAEEKLTQNVVQIYRNFIKTQLEITIRKLYDSYGYKDFYEEGKYSYIDSLFMDSTLAEYLYEAIRVLVFLQPTSRMKIFHLRFLNGYYKNGFPAVERLFPEMYFNPEIQDQVIYTFESSLHDFLKERVYETVRLIEREGFRPDYFFRNEHVNFKDMCSNKIEGKRDYELVYVKQNGKLLCIDPKTIMDSKEDTITIDSETVDITTLREGLVYESENLLTRMERMREIGKEMMNELGLS